MDDNDKTHNDHFSAAMPLPEEAQAAAAAPKKAKRNAVADLVRKKVEAAYKNAPSFSEEAQDLEEVDPTHKSKHQKFIAELTGSGKSLGEIHEAWLEYYAGLPDPQKHEVWQEFYDIHAKASHYAAAVQTTTNEPKVEPKKPKAPKIKRASGPASKTLADLRGQVIGGAASRNRLKPIQHLQSLLFGLGVGCIVLLIFLFSFFNERFIAPFIQPSRNATNTPIITSDTAVGSNPEVIIPKINVEIPVIYGVDTINDTAVENALEDGVVHYADTALPGQDGNVVVVGHSSNNIFNKGKYKFAFVLLSRLETGDTFYLQKDGKRYTYEVYEKEIVKPTDVSVLAPTSKPATATLITCDPPGTSTNRLVVIGEQIDPSPASNLAASTQNTLATQSAIIPGNSPSLWSRVWSWL